MDEQGEMATVTLPRVLGGALTAIGRDLPLFAGLGLLLVGASALLRRWGQHEAFASAALHGSTATHGWVVLILGLLQGIAAALLLMAVTHAIAARKQGRRAGLIESLGVALRFAGPASALGLVIGISCGLIGVMAGLAAAQYGYRYGMTNGSLLLFRFVGEFPAMLLWIVWSIAIPARMVEGTGLMKSVRRAMGLARGHYLELVPLALVTALASVGFVTLGSQLGDGFPYGSDPVRAMSIGAGVDMLTALLFAAIEARLYFDLRAAEPQRSADALAAVFD